MASGIPILNRSTKNLICQTNTGNIMNNLKPTDLPQTSNGVNPGKLTRAKTALNINPKCVNQNKPPAKPNLRRSKTEFSITTRGKAVKRPATTVMVSDAKRALVRTVNKPIAAQRTVGVAATTNKQTVTSRKPETAAATAAAAAKPSKWDLKGRLNHTTNELSTIRQKCKEATTKCAELEEIVDTLRKNETMFKTKLEEFEKLKEELKGTSNEIERLTKHLKETEEERENVSKKLSDVEQKYASQRDQLSRCSSELEILQANLEDEKKSNENLYSVNTQLQSLVYTMDKERRILHNAIQELKGNIRVFCRVRPNTESEIGRKLCTINYVDECTIEVCKSDNSEAASCGGKLRGTRHEFSFDKVFQPAATQDDVFKELSMLVQSALEGYNVCVFAYGQTGSGKTFTMEGTSGTETEGMIPRTVRHIFHEMKEFQLLGWEYEIEASFLEIYNEHIVDLLDFQSKTHEIRMADNKGHDIYVTNLKIQKIESPEELHECLLTAQQNRAVAATKSNERSSRSHSVARIRLIGTHRSKQEMSIGNLNLVDLAGSERLKGEVSERIAETKNINKSLANLGNVILALLKKQEHVPYRNSKLTHLLQPSLGGNSKTLMLLNVSPLEDCYNETLNSLRFASNVNNCKTGNIIRRTKTALQNSS